MSNTHLEYPYRANAFLMLACIALFGGAAAAMVNEALMNDRGLILNGIITLSVEGANRFYWAVAIVSTLFVLAALFALVTRFTNPSSISLTSTELVAPKNGFTRKRTSIRLQDIVEIGVQTVQKQRFMTVYHRAGKLSVAQSMLPNAAAFEALHAALTAKIARKAR